MDFSSALPTFVITLREGVEATLVVGIVLACLKKAKQSQLNIWVFAGVIAGIVASALVGLLFNSLIQLLQASYPQYAGVIEPLLEGGFGIVAIALLSWMLIWMTQQARFMKAQVEGAVTYALEENRSAGLAIFGLIFFAVLREGFETVVFIISNLQQGLFPALGAIAGLVAAVGIGVLLFKWGVKINIRQFFQFMGVLLLLIVAGLVATVLHNLDAAVNTIASFNRESQSLCFYYERFTKVHSCILGPMVWNTSKVLPDDQFPGVILKALFGYRDNIYVLQAVGYIVFLLTVGGIYFKSLNAKSTSSAKTAMAAGSRGGSPQN